MFEAQEQFQSSLQVIPSEWKMTDQQGKKFFEDFSLHFWKFFQGSLQVLGTSENCCSAINDDLATHEIFHTCLVQNEWVGPIQHPRRALDLG